VAAADRGSAGPAGHEPRAVMKTPATARRSSPRATTST
jgi:hypothetical protein